MKITFAFGRMNPPTIGHNKLVDVLAANEGDAKSRLYLSHSCDPAKNPLSFEKKAHYCELAFGDRIDVMSESNAKTVIFVLHELFEEGFTDITYVCGEDRAEDGMTAMIEKYNGYEGAKEDQYYLFDTISFVSAGARNEESSDLTEVASASLMRKYAADGDKEGFMSICPLDGDDAEQMFNDVVEAMSAPVPEKKSRKRVKEDIDSDEFELFEKYLDSLVESNITSKNKVCESTELLPMYHAPDEIYDVQKAAERIYKERTGYKYNTHLYQFEGGDVFIVFTTITGWKDVQNLLKPIEEELSKEFEGLRLSTGTCKYGGCIVIKG